MMKTIRILLMAVLWILPGEAQPSHMKRADRYSSDSLGKGTQYVAFRQVDR